MELLGLIYSDIGNPLVWNDAAFGKKSLNSFIPLSIVFNFYYLRAEKGTKLRYIATIVFTEEEWR